MPFVEKEVNDVNNAIHQYKSPGPDGMSPRLYQNFWYITGKNVTEAFLEYFTNCYLLEGFNDKYIVLIPKKTRPDTFFSLRPISSCNIFYKIVSKVVTNRLKG